MIRPIFIAIFCCVSLFAAGVAKAQDAPSRDQQSLLPEIDPQDIEIRSQFQARFPGLRRQPILGFNPRPRVFQIDPNRMPFIEDEEAVAANLPISELERPEAPVYRPLGYADPQNGFARFGLGSYLSPEADVFAMTRLGERNWVSGNLNYLSSNGHLEDLNSSFRDLDLDINTFTALSRRTKVSAHVGINSDFNHYPGLITENGEPVNIGSRNERFGIRGGVDFKHARTSLSGFDVGFNAHSNRFDITSGLDGYAGVVNDWGVRTRVEYSRLGQNVQEVHRIRFRNQTGGNETLLSGMETYSVSNLSAHYERLFNYQTDVKAELGVGIAIDPVNDFSLYLTPNVTVTHTLFSGLDVKGRLYAKPYQNTLSTVHRENRFTDFRVPLQHSYEAGVLAEVILEPFRGTRLNGGVSYQNIRNYLYYMRNENEIQFEGTDLIEGYYQPAFGRANIFKVYGGFTQDLRPDVLWISADGYWQVPRLTGNEKIPFIESLGLKASVAFRPARQVVIEGWTEYSARRVDSFGNDMSSFILIGSRFEISLTERLGVYGKLLNLTNEDYELWQGFPERGFQAFAGVTYLF
jgi:hypothetical protein